MTTLRIRDDHPARFRSGQAGELLGVVLLDGRPNYVVFWRDEKYHGQKLPTVDLWPVDDGSARYVFT